MTSKIRAPALPGEDPLEVPLGPEAVRAFRGTRSRAAFARLAGVTPLTIYRWELPDGAAEARRPRGAALARLRALLTPSETRVARADGSERASAPAPSSSPLPTTPPSGFSTPDPAPASELENALVLPLLERIFRGDGRRAESELLALMASRSLSRPSSLALAGVGLALVQLAIRGDARGSFASLMSALEAAEAGKLPAAAEAQVRAVAAMLFSWPEGSLFDLGRVHAHSERAEALARATSQPDARFFAWLARVSAAFTAGDPALLTRAFAGIEDVLGTTFPPLLFGFAEEASGLKAFASGHNESARRRFEDLAAWAQRERMPLLEARALGLLAVRLLDDLVEPAIPLELAQRSQRVAEGARLRPGSHLVFAARAEADAFIRLGRFEEASAAFERGHGASEEMGIPPFVMIPAEVRFHFLRGDAEALRALSRRLQKFELPSLREHVAAHVAAIAALSVLCDGDDAEAAILDFDRATIAANNWVFLVRELVVYVVPAYVRAGRLADADLAIRRAKRLLDRYPSPFATATLRHFEGLLFARRGRFIEARQRLEAAIGTFVLAGDVSGTALVRRTLAMLGQLAGEPGSLALSQQSEEEMRRLGIVLRPYAVADAAAVAVASSQSARDTAATGPSPDGGRTLAPFAQAELLVVPIQRLSVRGVGPAILQRELVSVLGTLFPDRAVTLEEIDSGGAAVALASSGRAEGEATEVAEFGDGSGRRLRIGVFGILPPGSRAVLSVVATVFGLSLEVATLRGLETTSSRTPHLEGDPTIEIPGFVAASMSLRRLRSELGRLSASRATVIITGESGVGKEVVARAIHQLSTRATKPYVAFNCAAVPRDLFEGQLFGYRRGAFTGAVSDHAGVLRAADGGTLFLDEVGELPLDVQPKLLRFLENGEVSPLGDTRAIHVDVRIVAATHRDLAALVKQGLFREDLYYRLQVVPIAVPPLRERRDDVLALARHFVRMYAPTPEDAPVLAPDALARLAAHPWPGNVRELRNVIERSMAFAPLPPVLTADHLRL